jgi:hypothetical protein
MVFGPVVEARLIGILNFHATRPSTAFVTAGAPYSAQDG